MFGQEFHSIEELDEITAQLASAQKMPLYVDKGQSYDGNSLGEPTGQLEPMNNKSVIWNVRDDEPAYFATNYTLVQHGEVIDMIKSAVSNTVGSIDKGIIRDYGTKVDGTFVFGDQDRAKIDVGDLVGEDYKIPEGINTRDELGLGLRFQNSFDGGTKIGGSTMGYRYICQNWMVWGEEEIGSVESAHVGEIGSDFFEEIIHEVFDTYDDLSGIVKKGEEQEVPTTWVPGLLDQAGFGNRYQKRIVEKLLEFTQPDAEHTTAWRIYNAITTHLDNVEAENIRQYTYNGHQDKAWKILTDEPTSPAEEFDLQTFVDEGREKAKIEA